jgi:hypothetical protein
MTSLEPAGNAVEVESVLRAVHQLGQRAIGGRAWRVNTRRAEAASGS